MRRVSGWVIAVGRSYASRVDDGDLVLWKPGRTIFLAPWGREQVRGPLRHELDRLHADVDPARRAVLERDHGAAVRRASVMREPDGGGGHRWGLYAWVLAGAGGAASALQLGLCFDLRADVAWAVAVVESVWPTSAAHLRPVVDCAGRDGHTALVSRRLVAPDRPPPLVARLGEPAPGTTSGWRLLASPDDDTDLESQPLTPLLRGDAALRDLGTGPGTARPRAGDAGPEGVERVRPAGMESRLTW